MDGQKVLEMLQPMREVLNDLEGAALADERLSSKTLLDMADKLTAAEMALRELTAGSLQLKERKTMKLEFTEWQAGHHWNMPEPVEVNRIEHAEEIFTAISRALNQGQIIRGKVMDSDGDVVARLVASDDESISEDEPRPGDIICDECLGFFYMCDCDGEDHHEMREEETLEARLSAKRGNHD